MKALAIPITTPKNPIKCHNLLIDIKNGKRKFTPEFALEFLQSTNNRKNIADFLDILESHLANHPEMATNYQCILFGIKERSELPEEVINKAEVLRQTYNIASVEIEISDKKYEVKGEDYRSICKLKFPKGLATLKMEQCDLSETEIDLSQSTFVTYMVFNACKMPSKLELKPSNIWSLYWFDINMETLEINYPKEVHWLDYNAKTKLPKILDLSNIEKANSIMFNNCDMSNVQEIKFPQQVKDISFYRVDIPSTIDIEKLKKNYYIILNECTLPSKKEPKQIELLSKEKSVASANFKSRLSNWLREKLKNGR
ncbi:MAG: hypothetical protein NC218_04710 [Acetobacter sp.]|nr:hypothetical protein [Acetobacter sp.]